MDPTFLDPDDPAIQLITVYIDTGCARHGRDRWMKKTKETLDYTALTALLH